MQTMTIIRGVPGSGKTTLAEAMYKSGAPAAHVEADMWRMDSDGKYAFDASKNIECHQSCYDSAYGFAANGASVIVSNTFVKLWEMQKYIDLADKFAMSLQVIECHGSFGNIHNVPTAIVDRMRATFEPYKAE